DVPALGGNARAGVDDDFVVEADESDGAFLHYAPAAAVITNVDADHLDMWGSVEAYQRAFDDFVGTVGELLVINVDDPGAARLAERGRETGLRVVTVGFDAAADVQGAELRVEGARTTARVLTSHDGGDDH